MSTRVTSSSLTFQEVAIVLEAIGQNNNSTFRDAYSVNLFALQQREEEMNQLRQAALAEAQTARSLMDKLSAQLLAETKKVADLQNQLQQTKQAITELQNKLK